MTRADAESPARLRTPGEVAAVIPLLTGFTPVESVVVVSLKEPRGRMGLTMRFDLPPVDTDGSVQRKIGRELVARLVHDKATRAVIVVHTSSPDDAGELPRAALLAGFTDELHRRGIRLTEALLVREGLWCSYTCQRSCCPRAGTPVADSEQAEPVTRLAAERVLSGRQVLGTRQELVASLAPVTPLGREVAEAALEAAELALVQQCQTEGLEVARTVTVDLVRAALGRRTALTAAETARVVVGLHDVIARDEVATLGLDQAGSLLVLLHELCRAAVPPWDAPVCTLLAWTAYVEGEGALANVGLERALSTDPFYSLALLLDRALTGQVAPSDIRSILEGTATVMGTGGAMRKERRQRRSPG